jgi:hypothetical protein
VRTGPELSSLLAVSWWPSCHWPSNAHFPYGALTAIRETFEANQRSYGVHAGTEVTLVMACFFNDVHHSWHRPFRQRTLKRVSRASPLVMSAAGAIPPHTAAATGSFMLPVSTRGPCLQIYEPIVPLR